MGGLRPARSSNSKQGKLVKNRERPTTQQSRNALSWANVDVTGIIFVIIVGVLAASWAFDL